MPDSIHPKRLTGSPKARLLAVATLVSGVLVAGCGGSSPSRSASTVRAATTSASRAGSADFATTPGSSTRAGATGAASTATGARVSALAFARCMRANGVPNFPDPAPGGSFVFTISPGFDPHAPAVEAAHAQCQKFMPNPNSGGPAFSSQALTKLLKIAQCMRQHGISEFPDPTTTRPSFSGIAEISNFDGVYLAFPTTLNLQSPAYRHALSACGSPPLGLSH